ncbi:MAG TPA: Holliday junction resolvase RuvX [Candidatus Bathyarchaeia archaeon]|nr:Holliday junction resolvase RuvX [Candidatus Bathyarchaeia archaeon]
MKILGLDIGDRWTGIALSDMLGITVKPYITVETKDLKNVIVDICGKEPIDTIVVGYPKTMKGTESEQTKKTVALFEELKTAFTHLVWVLYDERLSSKQAAHISSTRSKQERLKAHARAAAFILSLYLEHLNFQR